jgi:phosphatidylserine/phosphatidylglycerophosphate/cardiolipin synthase-like enzyme
MFMRVLSGDELWREIKKLGRRSKRKLAAVAYVSTDASVRFENGDTLIVDASKEAIAAGQTSAGVLNRAFKRGVEVRSLKGLHAKLMLFDSTVIIGSANISSSSENALVEVAILTSQPQVVSQARGLIELLRLSATEVDKAYLDEIGKIKVTTRRRAPKRGKKQFNLSQHQTWLVGVYGSDIDDPEDEADLAEEAEREAEKRLQARDSIVESLDWPKSNINTFAREAKTGDSIMQIWRESGKDKGPTQVFPHSTILKVLPMKKWTRYFLEEPVGTKNAPIPWKKFRTLAKQAGLTQEIGPNSCREIPEHVSEVLYALSRQR